MTANITQTTRLQNLLFETIELLRHSTQSLFDDWKDCDDWIFSELSVTKQELEEIYEGRGVMLYTASAVEND